MTDQRQKELANWFSQQMSIAPVQLETVSADASFRRYFRFAYQGSYFILVDAPPLTEKNPQFIDFSLRYAEQGIDVPRVIFSDLQRGFLCLTDLGNQLMLPLLKLGQLAWYDVAINQLRLIANVNHPEPPQYYNRDFFSQELGLFKQWFCLQFLELPSALVEAQSITDCFEQLISQALEQPQVSVHRDFHSRNIMIKDDHSLAIIDFQDTVIGPVTYDLVSLLKDCYFKIPLEARHKLLKKAYVQLVESLSLTCDFSQFEIWFDLMGLQRHLKVCGIFSRLSIRDNKPQYLDDLPLVMEYIIETCEKYPELSALDNLFKQHILPSLNHREALCTP